MHTFVFVCAFLVVFVIGFDKLDQERHGFPGVGRSDAGGCPARHSHKVRGRVTDSSIFEALWALNMNPYYCGCTTV